VQLLAQAARDLLDLELSEAQLALFQLYYEELVRRNAQINLTSILEYDAVQIRHFLDSLTLTSPRLRGDPPSQVFDLANAALVDIGAGAGFPGLPLKILYPKLQLTLVESVGKKAVFLREIADKLGFKEVVVLTGRAEDIGQLPQHRACYDLATGRAVAALAVLAEYCLPLLKLGGLFIAPKKGDLTSEIASAQKAIEILGGKSRSTPAFQLLSDETATPEARRFLVVVEKIVQTPLIYPRRAGLPAKKPLS